MNDKAALYDAACRESFGVFCRRAFRIIEPANKYEPNWHLDCIAEHLEAVYRGEIRRIIFNMPPRSLKTSLISIMFPAWVFGKTPGARFVNTSFKFERVEAMSFKCRHILNDEWYKECFPNTRLDSKQGQKHNFHTTERGQYYSSAILSATGEGGDYVLSDDPISPVDAFSATVRESTKAAIRGTLFSRFNDPRTGRFILTMQRVHDDDPTSDLMRDGGYTVVKLPAEATRHHIITLGKHKWEMQPGDLLFPSRLTKSVLEEKRQELGEANYVGQYLQEPVPLGGGELKTVWVQYYKNGSLKPREMNIVILVDPSGGEETNRKKKKLSDYTAMMVVGLMTDQNYYMLDAIRDRLNPTERVDTLFILHRKWAGLSGKQPKVGYEKYGMMTDTHYIKDRQNLDNYRFPLVELGGSMSKEERIRRLIPDFQMGRWYFPNTMIYVDSEGRSIDLVKELVESEIATFSRSRYDDMLDALSRVKDPELMLSFPKGMESKSEKLYRSMSEQNQSTSWTEW